MKKATPLGIARLLAYALGTLAVVTLYLVIPSLVLLSLILHDNWSRLLTALGLLALGGIAVLTVLAKTTSQHEGQTVRVERRGDVRVPVTLDVKVGSAHPGSGGIERHKEGERQGSVDLPEEGVAHSGHARQRHPHTQDDARD